MNETRSRPLGVLLGAVLAVAVGAVVLGAVFGTDGRPSGPDDAATSFARARDGLCQAVEAVREGDTDRARVVFFDRSHQRLHELAAAADTDRGATARLLEAKQRVENGLENASPRLGEDLRALAVATGRAMVAAGEGDPGPCPA